MPGDPTYAFGAPEPDTTPLVGLAAKGNIIIGDYTSDYFKNRVLPQIGAGGSKTQPYLVDPTDAVLGYDSHTPSLCGGRSPCFNGNYEAADGGTKVDGVTSRKFYESSLPDAEFQKLVSSDFTTSGSTVDIDGVLFTNHALAGLAPGHLHLNGTMIARDDALNFGTCLKLSHDIRLLNDGAKDLTLPFAIKPLKLDTWLECPASGCPDPQ